MGATISKLVDQLNWRAFVSLGVGAALLLSCGRLRHRQVQHVEQNHNSNKELIEASSKHHSEDRVSKITPRSGNFMAWYNGVIAMADLVDDAPVRGCKVMKPNGFAIWEAIQNVLNPRLLAMGVRNVYFPLLIPLDFFSREADHVEGFAKECAVVTHHRLRCRTAAGSGWLAMFRHWLQRMRSGSQKHVQTGSIEIDPESELAEPYIVRPTSETLVWHSFSRWIRSYRDLPLKINQWVNVMRWEHQTRTFLRGAEFLWQEGHTAHADEEESRAQARQVLDLYVEFAKDQLCLPLIFGRKSESEKFAGAEETYTMEVLAQNGMSIQAGTSHFLGQRFAKAFNVMFTSPSNSREQVWGTSWGVSTRLIGAVITALSDDEGLVLPPAVAPIQVIVLPVNSKDAEKHQAVLTAVQNLATLLQSSGLRVHVDHHTEVSLVQRRYEWERKGVPLRLEIGARDLESGAAVAKLRTGGDKFSIQLSGNVVASIEEALENARRALCERAQALKQSLTFRIKSREEFEERLRAQVPGFLLVAWGGNSDDEERVKNNTGATLRCYPFEQESVDNQICPLTGKKAREWAVFAKAF